MPTKKNSEPPKRKPVAKPVADAGKEHVDKLQRRIAELEGAHAEQAEQLRLAEARQELVAGQYNALRQFVAGHWGQGALDVFDSQG